MDPLTRIRRTIRDHALADASTRVVAAVSGGSDSIALLHLLKELDAAGDLRLCGIAHFNHQLRPAADSDERLVVGTAVRLGVPVLSDREDVRSRALRERRSIEAAARAARYEFFERARAHFGADAVALGHTRDDQAETFLLRLLRGAGPRGLGGMHPRHDTIIRPLIDCRRAELRDLLTGRGVGFVEDESNDDVTIPRNRVRAELLPLIEARFNPGIVDVLGDEATLAREAWETIHRLADESASRIVKGSGDEQRVQVDALTVLPAALRRVVLWQAMTAASGGRTVGFEHVSAALRLLDPNGPAILDAPGHRVERIGGRLVLTGRPSNSVGRWAGSRRNPKRQATVFEYPLSIPGEVVLAEAGCVVSAVLGSDKTAGEGSVVLSNGATARVRSDLCRGSLTIRNRRPGDRFRPVGLAGRKKLQDYFVDRKVAREDRDRVPIVVDERDRIVWVAGYGIDEAFRVTDSAQAVLLLRLRPV